MKSFVLAVLATALLVTTGCGGGGSGGGRRNNEEKRDPQGPNWEKLGERMVDFHGDHDTIIAAFQGEFRQIKIQVEGADLEMFNVKVNFGNGEHFSPATRFNFNQGTNSRTIDLPGAERKIISIEFRYKTEHRGDGKAHVEVHGRH